MSRGGKPQAAAVSGIGKKVVGASADYVKEQVLITLKSKEMSVWMAISYWSWEFCDRKRALVMFV